MSPFSVLQVIRTEPQLEHKADNGQEREFELLSLPRKEGVMHPEAEAKFGRNSGVHPRVNGHWMDLDDRSLLRSDSIVRSLLLLHSFYSAAFPHSHQPTVRKEERRRSAS